MLELLAVPSIAVTIVVTVVVVGFGALSTGLALGRSWKPIWHVWLYCLLLGAVDRFLTWGLFNGNATVISGFLIDTAYLIIVGSIAHQATRASKMVTQYPWLYERAGPLAWRRKSGTD